MKTVKSYLKWEPFKWKLIRRSLIGSCADGIKTKKSVPQWSSVLLLFWIKWVRCFVSVLKWHVTAVAVQTSLFIHRWTCVLYKSKNCTDVTVQVIPKSIILNEFFLGSSLTKLRWKHLGLHWSANFLHNFGKSIFSMWNKMTQPPRPKVGKYQDFEKWKF